MSATFLTARWTNLLMANFKIDKAILQPYCPVHTELDQWNGDYYVSMVGFLFEQTKLKGLAVPFHQHFEEVNLRFYVRYQDKNTNEWKRGAVFIKEIVPKTMISLVANTLYGEHYETRAMQHDFLEKEEQKHVAYRWQVNKKWNFLECIADSKAQPLQNNTEEEFITEHYWGYTQINPTTTNEYEVRHPRWNIHEVKHFSMLCDIKTLYGEAFFESLSNKPSSVFLADGSPISIMGKATLKR